MNAQEFMNKYKNGDILIIGEWLIIYHSLRPHDMYNANAIVYHALMHIKNNSHLTIETRTGIGYIEQYDEADIRLATNREIEHFLSILATRNTSWDFKEKCIVEHTRVVRILR